MAEDGGKELVDAGHQGNGSKVGDVIKVIFLIDEDGHGIFAWLGTSFCSRQRLKIMAKILACKSRRFKWQYWTRSEPGEVLAAERSFCEISWGVISS